MGAKCYRAFDELVSWETAAEKCVDWGIHNTHSDKVSIRLEIHIVF
jgi:hypothetical protein